MNKELLNDHLVNFLLQRGFRKEDNKFIYQSNSKKFVVVMITLNIEFKVSIGKTEFENWNYSHFDMYLCKFDNAMRELLLCKSVINSMIDNIS